MSSFQYLLTSLELIIKWEEKLWVQNHRRCHIKSIRVSTTLYVYVGWQQERMKEILNWYWKVLQKFYGYQNISFETSWFPLLFSFKVSAAGGDVAF